MQSHNYSYDSKTYNYKFMWYCRDFYWSMMALPNSYRRHWRLNAGSPPVEEKMWVAHLACQVQFSEPCVTLAPPCGH